MSEYKKLQQVAFSANRSKVISKENIFWKRFKTAAVIKEHSAISCIEFSAESNDFLTCSGTRMQIFCSNTNSIKKTISRFKDVVFCGSFREDGKLVVGGDASGLIQLFDISTRNVLRSIKAHKGSVRTCKFVSDKVHLFSTSDDFSAKLWDIPTESIVQTFSDHSDYVRAGATSITSSNIFLTGSYDHTVNLWDSRQDNCVIKFNHGSPVEAVLILPGDLVAVSAGSNLMKVWDIVSGKLLCTAENHQKTITSLCFDKNYSRILSGSLDQMVKVFDTCTYKVNHTIKFTSPVMALGLSKDQSCMAVGMNNGFLAIKKRSSPTEQVHLPEKAPNPGTKKYYERGPQIKPDLSDFVVIKQKSHTLPIYDKFLKSFDYRNALDAALLKAGSTNVVCDLLTELIHRNGLKIALSERNDESLFPICKFILKNMSNPDYSKLMIDVCSDILDIYAGVVGQSAMIDEIFLKLQSRVHEEIYFQKQLLALLGSIDVILS